MSALLSVEGLASGYSEAAVVRDLSLHVEAGEVVSLLGPNGAGKTTTLLTLAGLLKPLRGDVALEGAPLVGERAHVTARRGLMLVPDDRALFAGLTAAQNLALGRHARRESSRRLLELFPELEGRLGVRAGMLSGGEQQMLAVGRAVLTEPKVLLIDEMSLGLAPVIVKRIIPVVRRLADERGVGVLLVEQHVQLALEVSDRAYVLRHGQLVLEGSAADLLRRPEVLQESYLG